MNRYAFVLYGALFGLLLSLAGATTYDFYVELFIFEDLQLMWVIGAAALVGALGLTAVKRAGNKTVAGSPIVLKPKPWKTTLIPGALLLGVGWGVAGTCPGTSLTMIGQGKLSALIAAAGIVLGTYIYGWVVSQEPEAPAPSAEA